MSETLTVALLISSAMLTASGIVLSVMAWDSMRRIQRDMSRLETLISEGRDVVGEAYWTLAKANERLAKRGAKP